MFMMTLDEFRVSWEPPQTQDGAADYNLSAGSLLVSKDMNYPNDIERLVHVLLRNGATKVVIELYNPTNQWVTDVDLDGKETNA